MSRRIDISSFGDNDDDRISGLLAAVQTELGNYASATAGASVDPAKGMDPALRLDHIARAADLMSACAFVVSRVVKADRVAWVLSPEDRNALVSIARAEADAREAAHLDESARINALLSVDDQ